jgi:Flp pilus assembly protein TadD
MGGYIAISMLKDFDSAEQLCQIGLQANPWSPEIINNYCYLLAVQDRVKEAAALINRFLYHVKIENLNSNEKIALQATIGLIYFRQGLTDLARDAYKQALSNAKKSNNTYMYNLGLLNLLREEMRINSVEVTDLITQLEKGTKNETNLDVLFLKNELLQDNMVVNIKS